MSYNTKQGFEAMQEDAIRRVREMQKRAKNYVDITPNMPVEDNLKDEKLHTENTKQNSTRSNSNSHNNKHYNNAQFNSHRNNQHNSNARAENNSENTNKSNEKPQNNQSNSHQQYNNRQTFNNGFSSPFSQLFGSNLGGFNKMKKPPPATSSCDNSAQKPNLESSKDLIGNLLKEFQIDDEKLMLILLIYVLYKNGSDFKLMAALGYLLL